MDPQTTVLVIDDFDLVLECLSAQLEEGGFRVITAKNGREGLEAFAREVPQVVLVDLQMPVMDGLSVIAELHRTATTTPVIAISGENSIRDALVAVRCGAWDYLSKPIHAAELEIILDRCLERARMLAENIRCRERLEDLVQTRTCELEKSRTHYRKLLESVTNYVYTVILQNSLPVKTIHHPGCEEITGYRPEEFSADPGLWSRMVHEDDRLQVFGMTQHMLTGSEKKILEHRIYHKDGSIRWVTNTLVPFSELPDIPGTSLPPSATELVSYDGIITDITKRKTAEEKLQQHMANISSLRSIDQAINGSLDMKVILNVLLHETLNRLKVDAACILLQDPAGLTLECALGKGFGTDCRLNSRVRIGEGYAGRIAHQRTRMLVPDIPADFAGCTHCQSIKNQGFRGYMGIPLITKGQVKGVMELYQRHPLNPNSEWIDFAEALAGQAAIAVGNLALFNNLQRSNQELMLAYDTTIEGWSRALDYRDRETVGHCKRVPDLTIAIATAMGIGGERLVHMRRGALLHDIGKLGVPDSILLKPGPLDEEEFAVMKQHTEIAFRILSPIEFLRPAMDIPYCHHEKWNGGGYPRGLQGEEIPLAARIFAVVDVWDALRSDRPYRTAWPQARALDFIRSQAGIHFDPDVVRVFERVEGLQNALPKRAQSRHATAHA